jgi:hypothetical protein
MKKIQKQRGFWVAAVAVVFLSVLPAGIALAQSVTGTQSTPSASDLLAAVSALQAIDAARQSVLKQIDLQFAQITEEQQNISAEPRNTLNEQEALAAEESAIAAKLNQLSNAANILDQIQATENSLFASLQADMRALGL